MNIGELLDALQQAIKTRVYFIRLDILDQSTNLLKARLHISPELFVQIYRNDRYNTTNFAIIHNERRLYARDQIGGVWHRHTTEEPELHDTSTERQRSVTLLEFLSEVESLLAARQLP